MATDEKKREDSLTVEIVDLIRVMIQRQDETNAILAKGQAETNAALTKGLLQVAGRIDEVNATLSKGQAETSAALVQLAGKVTETNRRVDGLAGKVDGLAGKVDVHKAEVHERLARLERAVFKKTGS